MAMTQEFATLRRDVFDTFNGELITLPKGYRVKINGNPTQDTFSIECLMRGGVVKALATHDDLFDTPLPITPADEPEEIKDPYPLTPRIYQEFGITWLIWRKKGILADAPGVGKTLQASEAASRVMRALTEKRDPLAYCYNTSFAEDALKANTKQSNPHPHMHPIWALPKNEWPELINPDNYNSCTVIIAPTHLCGQWFKYIRKQYPDDSVSLAVNDTKENRMRVLRPGYKWYIVNYEMMRPAPEPKNSDYEEVEVPYTTSNGQTYTFKERRLKATYQAPVTYSDLLTKLKPICAIFDECHKLKSPKSKQAKECADFSAKIPYKFLLSATPIKREADDLYHQLHIIDPSMFHRASYFLDDYCLYDRGTYANRNVRLRTAAKRNLWVNRVGDFTQEQDNTYFSQMSATDTINKAYKVNFYNPNLKGYILGRSYKDVGLYLPEVISATIPVLLETSVREVYEQIKTQYRATFQDLADDVDLNSFIAVLHTLRFTTAASQNKIDAVKNLVEENPGPHLIFCEYTGGNDMFGPGASLAKALDGVFISGNTPSEERMSRILDAINQGKPVVTTGKAVGTGVNGMESCKTVIFFEEDYTPGEMYQRISRVQRYDPNLKEDDIKDPILVFYVNCVDTIDERVHEIQSNRSASIKDVIKVELAS